MNVSNKTYHIKEDPYFAAGERIIADFISANHEFNELSIGEYEGDTEIWYIDRDDTSASVLAYANGQWEIEYRYITFADNVDLSNSSYQVLTWAYDEYIEPKRLRIIYNGQTKLAKINGMLKGSFACEQGVFPFDNRAKWPTPTVTLDGSTLSTELVEGVTKYKVYSNGSYIGYVDPDGTWHGEAPQPTIVAGLYDENDDLIVSYEDSGMDVTIDYTDATYNTDPRSGYSTMQRYPHARKIILPNSATIGERTFIHCSELVSVVIPEGVTIISRSMFYQCGSLSSISIPNSVTSIGRSSFSSCKSLTSITIPNSVTSIGDYAFDGCSSLTSITIPSGVNNIGIQAFIQCSNLTSVTFAENSQCSSIGRHAFAYCGLTSITIPASVTSVDSIAFSGSANLRNIYVPWAEGAVPNAPWGATNATIHYNWTPTPAPSGFTVTLTYGVAEVANDGETKIKFGTPPTSGNDYDYVTSYGYDTPRCLYDKSGNRITSPVTIENVTTCYIFHSDGYGSYRIVEGTANISGNSYETTSYGSTASDYGQLIRINAGNFSNPDVVTLTSDVTLKIMATED